MDLLPNKLMFVNIMSDEHKVKTQHKTSINLYKDVYIAEEYIHTTNENLQHCYKLACGDSKCLPVQKPCL